MVEFYEGSVNFYYYISNVYIYILRLSHLKEILLNICILLHVLIEVLFHYL